MLVLLQTIGHSATYVRHLLTHWDTVERATTLRLAARAERAVLLVPGFLGTRGALSALCTRFEREGTPAFTLNTGLLSVRSLDTTARMLVTKIRRIQDRFPLRRLDMVAHSLGGLVALDVIRHGFTGGLETRLVTLGSPFRGTWAAALGCPLFPAAREMLPLHPRYWTARRALSTPPLPFLSIAGTFDVLAPPERCRHPEARCTVLPVDHAGLVLRKSVFHEIRSFLAQ